MDSMWFEITNMYATVPVCPTAEAKATALQCCITECLALIHSSRPNDANTFQMEVDGITAAHHDLE